MKRGSSCLALLLMASFFSITSPAVGAPAPCLSEPKPRLAYAIEENRDVFVGTVYNTSFDDLVALFEVHEVWKGYIYTDFVEVKGVPGGSDRTHTGKMRGIARHWKEGETYLVLPSTRIFRQFRDNACTRTQIYTPRLDRFRPATAATPMPKPPPSPRPDYTSSPSPAPGGETSRSSFPVLPVGIALLVLGATAIWLKSNKR